MLKTGPRGDPSLLYLAEAAGLVPEWQDVHGRLHHVHETTLRQVLDMMGLRCDTPTHVDESLRRLRQEADATADTMVIAGSNEDAVLSYVGPMQYEIALQDGHRLTGTARSIGPHKVAIPAIGRVGYHRMVIGSTRLTLAIAPGQCPSVAELAGGPVRAWGVAAQVYSLRHSVRQESRAIINSNPADAMPVWPGWTEGGDFAALASLGKAAARQGACAIAISPVHAMFSADPLRYSPYSPSSRLFLNVGYIEPSIVLGRDAVQRALEQLDLPEPSDLATQLNRLEWHRLLPARLKVLRRLFENFQARGPSRLVEDFLAFRRQAGESLESHCRYEAMHAHYAAAFGTASGWQDWPVDVQDCTGAAVQRFAAAHDFEVRFHAFLQWLAHKGMQFAQQSVLEAGMTVGLITDLAIGTDPRGSHAWSRQGEMLTGISVGAAPDLYHPRGQDWGLTAFSPVALRHKAYGPFIETLRAALAHAGGVRIDHILGLGRMWLIPQGAEPADGVYLRYPLDDMLRLIALEASMHRAIIIGENLGTIPEGFNDKLEKRGIMGTSVLWFQRASGLQEEPQEKSQPGREPSPVLPFTSPSGWPPHSTATPTTHDLPTINGWWTGRDLQWRVRLRQLTEAQGAEQAGVRAADKKALWRALRDAHCVADTATDIPDAAPRDAILSFVARTPSALFLVSLEDLASQVDQPNLPGTSGCEGEAHPNWSQSLTDAVEDFFRNPEVSRGVAVVVKTRGQA